MSKNKRAADFCNNVINNLNTKNDIVVNKYNKKQVSKLKENSPVDTGKLKRSIKSKNNKIEMLDYGLTLNEGSSSALPTYWIDKSISQCQKEITNIIINNIFK